MTLTIMTLAPRRWSPGIGIGRPHCRSRRFASMAAFTSMRPGADPHLGYDWLALQSRLGLRRYASQAGQRYRREIATELWRSN